MSKEGFLATSKEILKNNLDWTGNGLIIGSTGLVLNTASNFTGRVTIIIANEKALIVSAVGYLTGIICKGIATLL